MGLHHHGAAGRQRGSGVAAGNREGEREIAGPEDRHRPYPDAVLPDVGAGERLPVGKRRVDARIQEVPPAHHGSEQAQLVRGAGALAPDARLRKSGLPHHQLHEAVIESVDLGGDRFQEARPLLQCRFPVIREGGASRGGRLQHFRFRRLEEGIGQRLPRGRVVG